MSFSNYSEQLIQGVELYDYKNDPEETVNEADNPEFSSVRKQMTGYLKHYFAKCNDPAKAEDMLAKMKKFRRKK